MSRSHPQQWVINETIERPDAAAVAALRAFATTQIADSGGPVGVVSPSLRPPAGGAEICGTAVTVWTKPGDILFVTSGRTGRVPVSCQTPRSSTASPTVSHAPARSSHRSTGIELGPGWSPDRSPSEHPRPRPGSRHPRRRSGPYTTPCFRLVGPGQRLLHRHRGPCPRPSRSLRTARGARRIRCRDPRSRHRTQAQLIRRRPRRVPLLGHPGVRPRARRGRDRPGSARGVPAALRRGRRPGAGTHPGGPPVLFERLRRGVARVSNPSGLCDGFDGSCGHRYAEHRQ